MPALQDVDGALFGGVPDNDSLAVAAPEDVDRAAHAAATQAAATSAGIGKFLNQWSRSNPFYVHELYNVIMLETIWDIHWLLRLVFPTLQKNESVFTILPQYISVLGKKIDNAAVQKD